MNRILTLLAALACLLATLSVSANQGSVIEAVLPSGRVISADFHAGHGSLPAVFILHGFLQTRAFPIGVIMGGKNERMGADWLARLASRGIPVRVIPGAAYFFDDQYEFDLQETVLQALSGRPPGR